MRERFEAYASKAGWKEYLYGFERMDNGSYLDLYMEFRWQGWQGCLKAEYEDRTEEV